MKLLHKLYNVITFNNDSQKNNTHTTDKNGGVLESCSVTIGVDTHDQYFFEIKWDGDITHTPDKLSNLIIGLNYGFFTKEICDILRSHDGNELDTVIINKSLQSLSQKQNAIQAIVTKTKTSDPLIKPSQVFNT